MRVVEMPGRQGDGGQRGLARQRTELLMKEEEALRPAKDYVHAAKPLSREGGSIPPHYDLILNSQL